MSLEALYYNAGALRDMALRDRRIPLPHGVIACRNITYGSHGKWSLLDVYYPENTASPLPTVVFLHGGGFVSGSKEAARRYCMVLAEHGFSVVSFNYRLAPGWQFPAPLWDTNMVLEWVEKNARRYHLDPDRIFLLGDAAGAQLAFQYAAIHSNPKYAALFHMEPARVRLLALGLNCGIYDPAPMLKHRNAGILRDYLGPDCDIDDPRYQILRAVTPAFPPAYLATGRDDHLKPCAPATCRFLAGKGVRSSWKSYGETASHKVGHHFSTRILTPEAALCMQEECAFFRCFL